jgi:hypothetical protein
MRRFLKILLITLGALGVAVLGLFGWLAYKHTAAAQRRDELLKDFVQVSDDFTLPKVYQHKTFAQRTAPPAQLVATSYGRITFKDRSYISRLTVNHDGVIIEDATGGSAFSEVVKRLCSLKPEEVAGSEIKCRLWFVVALSLSSSNQDFTLQGEDKEAFIRTFELAECFHWNLW